MHILQYWYRILNLFRCILPVTTFNCILFRLPGWVGAVPVSLPMLAAPVATLMHFKYGTRLTVLLGTVVSVLGCGLAAVRPHIATLFVGYGVLGGLGFTMRLNPPFILLDEYFPYHHPRHVLVTSIVACAFPLGKYWVTDTDMGTVSRKFLR